MKIAVFIIILISVLLLTVCVVTLIVLLIQGIVNILTHPGETGQAMSYKEFLSRERWE
jgi:hypothetical protein